MERQTITVDIAPGNSQVERLGSSQGDIGRPLGVYIIQNGVALDCSTYSAELYILKPDGKFYTTQATVDSTETNLIKWDTAEQETPVAGACAAQIRIAAGDDDIGTARFVEFVEASPCDMGSASESEVALLTEYVRQARESAESAGRDATTASGAASSASGSASTATTAANTATQAATAATAAADRAEAVEESIPADYSQLSDDVSGLKSAISDLHDVTFELGDGLISEVQTVITNLTTHSGYRYGADGALVEVSLTVGVAKAVEIPVVPGQKIRWTCYQANANSTWNVKYLMRDGSVVADTNYTDAGEYTFTVPLNCDKLLVSCWVVNGENTFYLYGYETTPAKQYVDELIADVDNSIDDIQSDLQSITNTVFDIESISGEIITINDSVLDYCKSIDTEASALYRCGVNIWNEEWELGTYTSDGGPGYSNDCIRSKNDSPIPVKPNTEYYFTTLHNVALCYYRADGTFINYEILIPSNKVFTTPANAYYLRFRCVSDYGTTYNNDIQIALNSDPDKATYHAHTTQQVSDVSALKIVPNARNYIYAVASDDSVAVEYYVTKAGGGGKKPYKSGFIIFSVPSRLTKSNNSVGASAVSEGTDDSQNVNCILKLPAIYTPSGKPTKLIMICHGAGQSAQQWSTKASYIALTDAFINAGYAVFDCNGYIENVLGYSFWGDSRGVDVWRKAYQYVVDNYNVEQTFGLYGFSMGGLTALNLLFSGFPGIKCVALGSPVVSLEACYNSESVSAVIKTLYGMGDTYDPSKAYACNPYARIVTIDNTKYIFGAFPPIKLWYGSTETGITDTGSGEVVTGVVVKAYGNDIVQAINNAGGQAEYREVEGAGHEICYGGNATVTSDYILFFNRHNKI